MRGHQRYTPGSLMSDRNEHEESASSRRAFFKHSFLKAAEPVVDAVEHMLPLPDTRAAPALLRPPGALPEVTFLQTCHRSGNCMDACPANAIQPLRHADPNLSGTPTVIPSERACVVCDELACMSACPSGALTPILRHQIRIGLAVVRYGHCVRTDGQDCVLCIEQCPVGRTAIGLLEDGMVGVSADGCVGCGVCEEVCPTTPKAIHIHPIPSRAS